MKMIKYPSIEQMRNVIRSVSTHSSFVGLNHNNEPIYDKSRPKPTIKFIGTVKAHGTNSSVCYNSNDGFWCQSREQLLSIEKDNAGFCLWANQRKEWFIKTIEELNIDLNIYTITIYGEFVGKGIQSGVAVSQLDKSMLIFGIKVSHQTDSEFVNYWLPLDIKSKPEINIFNIRDFGIWELDIDFNYPEKCNKTIIDLVDRVEKCCPIGKYFNIDGVGEGIVWASEDQKYVFKTKGQLHSVSKVKKVAEVDVEKITSCRSFAEYAVTENRVKQACEKIFGIGVEPNITKTGDIIKWVISDVLKEEIDTIIENGLEPKDVNSYIGSRTRNLFMEMIS